ncbi:MAG: F0F1 ATP synthase subunit A [Candidatus Peribacteria bacterium]|nr:F0F1 ATP synthase subunit A [Candidatus Peribacteria bacterium]
MIKIEKTSLPKIVYYTIIPLVKLFDIVISLFMAVLDIVGIIAKVISLAFRLYGNMMAGSILIGMIIVMLGQAVKNRIGIEFPFLVPLIFYLQSALTAIVQAFVFGLLTSVFIKMSLEEDNHKKRKKLESPFQQELVQSIQREVVS